MEKRIIKFRAFHKEQKRFIDLNGMSTWFCLHPDCGEVYGISEQGVVREYDISEIELSQFTGLLDKNGVEVYEGDLCKHENGNIYEVKYGEFTESVNLGEYSNMGYGFHFDTDTLEDFEQIHNPHKFEIIGNIYANPSLLTK